MTESQQRPFSRMRSLSADQLDKLSQDPDAKQVIDNLRNNPNPMACLEFYVDSEKMEGNVSENNNGVTDKNGYVWVVPLSILYGILLVVIGLVATVGEGIHQQGRTSSTFVAGFLAFLYIGSAIHLLIIIIFRSPRWGRRGLRRHMIRKAVGKVTDADPSVSTVSGKMEGDALSNGPLVVRIRNYDHDTGSSKNGSISDIGDSTTGTNTTENGDMNSMASGLDSVEEAAIEDRLLLQQRTATQGHEGSGFFLRLGCLLFGIGNMVYIALEINAAEQRLPDYCQSGYSFPLYLQMVFVVWQTLFLFKYTTAASPRYTTPSRFGLQHVVATNIVIWMQVLMKEINEALEHAEHSAHEESSNSSSSTNESTVTDNCTLQTLAASAVTPYFFPFVLEYSLIAMSVMVGIYQTLSVRVEVNLLDSLKRAMKRDDKERNEDPEAEEFFAHAHNGLFKGALVLALTLIVIILSSLYDKDGSEFVHNVIETLQYAFILFINSQQIIAIIFGVWCFRRLETTFGRSNQIDEILLILSVAGLILLQIFIMFGIIHGLLEESGELSIGRTRALAVELTGNVMTVVFAIIQSCFILQGLQTHTSSKEHQRNKPGREVVTFLVVTNIAMWVYASFTEELVSEEVLRYYGDAWPIISSLCRPLGLFFRFHSSICFADIWSTAYMAEESGLKYKVF